MVSQHLPLIPGIRIANQTLTAHLWRVQYGRCIAVSTLWIPVVGHHEPASDCIDVLFFICQASAALIAADSRRAARVE